MEPSLMKSVRTACYVSVSKTERTPGMESQVRALNAFCELNNIKDIEFFCDIEFAGAVSSRPTQARMMAAVERDEISSIIVCSLCRFAKSPTDLDTALGLFRKRRVYFVSLAEKIDTRSSFATSAAGDEASRGKTSQWAKLSSHIRNLRKPLGN